MYKLLILTFFGIANNLFSQNPDSFLVLAGVKYEWDIKYGKDSTIKSVDIIEKKRKIFPFTDPVFTDTIYEDRSNKVFTIEFQGKASMTILEFEENERLVRKIRLENGKLLSNRFYDYKSEADTLIQFDVSINKHNDSLVHYVLFEKIDRINYSKYHKEDNIHRISSGSNNPGAVSFGFSLAWKAKDTNDKIIILNPPILSVEEYRSRSYIHSLILQNRVNVGGHSSEVKF